MSLTLFIGKKKSVSVYCEKDLDQSFPNTFRRYSQPRSNFKHAHQDWNPMFSGKMVTIAASDSPGAHPLTRKREHSGYEICIDVFPSLFYILRIENTWIFFL